VETTGDRAIASCIGLFVDAAWWLAVTGLALLTGLLLCSFFVDLEGKNLALDLPVTLELKAPIEGGASIVPVGRLERARANIRFPVHRGVFFSATMFFVVLLFGALLWGLTQLRRIFRSIRQGRVFVLDNARRIRWLGLTVVFGEFARAAIFYFWSYYTSVHFTANGLRFVAATDISAITVLGGCAILVIAQVFQEGIRLSEEQSLTI
jgi:hypothetical protein